MAKKDKSQPEIHVVHEDKDALQLEDAEETSWLHRLFCRKRILFYVIVVLLPLLIVGIVYAVDYFVFEQRAYPGTTIGGIDVSNMSYEDVESLITDRVDSLLEQEVEFIHDEQKWKLSVSELGITYDIEDTMADVRISHIGPDTWQGIKKRWQALTDGITVEPDVTLNSATFEKALRGINNKVGKAEQNATIYYDGEQFVIRSSNSGITLSYGLMQLQLLEGLKHFEVDSQQVYTVIIEPLVYEDDIEGFVEQADTWLDKEIMLEYKKDRWPVPNEQFRYWIGTRPISQHEAILSVNTSRAFDELWEIAEQSINRPPQEGVFTMENDKVIDFVPSQEGITLDVAATLGNIDDALAELLEDQQSITAELAVDVTPPETETGDGYELGIRELVGRGVSYYRGSSWARIYNIKTAVNSLNGTIIEPGEVFSYNSTLGDVTISNGYVVGLIISGGMTKEGVGGGVCQPSTTTFRAALDGGFPIVEQHFHAYRVHYYEEGGPGYEHAQPGIDATVYSPSKDFRFENDTPYHILMQAYVDEANAKLTIDLYSTGIGRTTEITEPLVYNYVPPPASVYFDVPDQPVGYIKQVDWSAPGSDTSFQRIITNDDGTVIEETYTAHYKAWSAKYERGTMGAEPESTPI